MSRKFAQTSFNRSPKTASRARASSSAPASRSIPSTSADGPVFSRMSSVCPPVPTVPSTKRPDLRARSSSTAVSARTGVCRTVDIAAYHSLPAEPAGIGRPSFPRSTTRYLSAFRQSGYIGITSPFVTKAKIART